MQSFIVCIHDATPAFARDIARLLDDLEPLVGHQVSLGVVPNWHGQWPLSENGEFCDVLRTRAHELLLHGYRHDRRDGYGAVSLLAERSDEMNGLSPDETAVTVGKGQSEFESALGARAKGFLAPAWQQGHVQQVMARHSIEYALGFFSLDAIDGQRMPLATYTWDCGRWGPLGHVGHASGRVLQQLGRRVPVLAIHPRDLNRGFWPTILDLTRDLLERGLEPESCSQLLGTSMPSLEMSASMNQHASADTSRQFDAQVTV